jgi:CheY-like chemotaxis protein
MKRVLIVHDSSYNLFVMQELLQTIPAIKIIKTAMNGQECLDLLKENKSQSFDVVFLDIQMPIMDGMQTIKIIREWQSKREIDLSRT